MLLERYSNIVPPLILHAAVTATTTVVTTQFLPQPDVQGSRYLPYQPLPNNPPYGGQPMPIGPFKGQPYQEAGNICIKMTKAI